MVGQRRQQQLEREAEILEGEFRARLIAALEKCAAGKWGLFGQSDLGSLPRSLQQRLRSKDADALLELGAQISEARQRAGNLEPFDLYDRFQKTRRLPRGCNTPGEPKLAQQWLAELAKPR